MKDFNVFRNARTLYPSIWLGKLMINLNISLSHFMKVIELYLILRDRCVRVTDEGVIAIAQSCTSLEFLRYYHILRSLLHLDNCYPRITFWLDVLDGHICSLFGIVGVTDKCLAALSKSCSNSIMTLDVNGCIGIKANSYFKPITSFNRTMLSSNCSLFFLQKRSRAELLQLFPYLKCFKVHS